MKKKSFEEKMAKDRPGAVKMVDYLDWKYSSPIPTKGIVEKMIPAKHEKR